MQQVGRLCQVGRNGRFSPLYVGLGARVESSSKRVTQGRLGYPRKKKIYCFVVPNSFVFGAYFGGGGEGEETAVCYLHFYLIEVSCL